jgi:hypothetical protein
MGEDDRRRFGHRPGGRFDDSVQYRALRLGDGRELRRRTNADSGTVANVNTVRDTWSDRHPGTDDRTADAMSYGVQSWGSAVSSGVPGANGYAQAANGDTHEDANGDTHETANGDTHETADSNAVSARMLVERQKMHV